MFAIQAKIRFTLTYLIYLSILKRKKVASVTRISNSPSWSTEMHFTDEPLIEQCVSGFILIFGGFSITIFIFVAVSCKFKKWSMPLRIPVIFMLFFKVTVTGLSMYFLKYSKKIIRRKVWGIVKR